MKRDDWGPLARAANILGMPEEDAERLMALHRIQTLPAGRIAAYTSSGYSLTPTATLYNLPGVWGLLHLRCLQGTGKTA